MICKFINAVVDGVNFLEAVCSRNLVRYVKSVEHRNKA